ncbi:MAG: Hsp20/alpha crystallin family protein [Candidatus Kerfeldbacteria bacterium]|nr:Hsp20/alpha crystallin family protein [Candidatus Kerfeldbacteria bacterium]
MRITRWNPIAPVLYPNMEDMLQGFPGMMSNNFSPALDVYEKDNTIIVETPLPGIDPNRVQISIENDVLSIEGSMEKKSEVDEKDYYRKEVQSGSFHRAVALPSSVDGDKAEASYADGVLKITVPKATAAQKKTIKVNTK